MKGIILSITVICVISAALFFLCPKGKMEKVMKYALGIFFISSLIVAVLSADFNVDFNLDTEGNIEQTETKIADSTVTVAISQILLKNHIRPIKIELDTDKTKDGSISIKRVLLTLEKDEQFDLASKIIKEETGITAVEQ
ncbi:MAG: hypothetical protein IJE01_02380 [Clostridia bacterium]|nr:hypothetical protein [Clostridia bacterium]